MERKRTAPIPRPGAPLLVIDEQDRLLLFHIEDPAIDAPVLWLPPGGGLRPGETHEQAAVRELWEETGIVAPHGPCVWHRRHVARYGDRWYEARERFFVVRVTDSSVSADNWEAHERAFIVGHGWWPLPDIAASVEAFVPSRLAALLPPLFAHDYPAEPITVGP